MSGNFSLSSAVFDKVSSDSERTLPVEDKTTRLSLIMSDGLYVLYNEMVAI